MIKHIIKQKVEDMGEILYASAFFVQFTVQRYIFIAIR